MEYEMHLLFAICDSENEKRAFGYDMHLLCAICESGNENELLGTICICCVLFVSLEMKTSLWVRYASDMNYLDIENKNIINHTKKELIVCTFNISCYAIKLDCRKDEIQTVLVFAIY
jgi:hypothetical protein